MHQSRSPPQYSREKSHGNFQEQRIRTLQNEPGPTSGPAGPEGALRRTMGPRHLVMIAMGGVIGSGLFLSSGYTISQAGPLGAVIAYLVGAFVVYLVMACLGELAMAYPVSGAFHIYASRSISPATGFTTAWLYWLCWAVAIGSEFTASGLLMQRWFPGGGVDLVRRLRRHRVRRERRLVTVLRRNGVLVLHHQGRRHRGPDCLGGAALLGFHPLPEVPTTRSCSRTSTLRADCSPTASPASWSPPLQCSTRSPVRSSSASQRGRPPAPRPAFPRPCGPRCSDC